jgi:hypothetical protein
VSPKPGGKGGAIVEPIIVLALGRYKTALEFPSAPEAGCRANYRLAMGWTPPPSNGIDVPKWKCWLPLNENGRVRHEYYNRWY